MSHIAPTPSPDAAPATVPESTAALDAHGHDPAAYDWVPVLKKRRKDGWSPDKQRAFIEALADSGSVATAAQRVDMSESSAYHLRRAPGAEAFDRAWSAAIDAASKKLLDAAFERALVGTDEPVFDRDGHRVGRRLRQSDRLLMFLLRAYGPDCFRDAAAARRTDPAPAPVAEALTHLHPAPARRARRTDGPRRPRGGAGGCRYVRRGAAALASRRRGRSGPGTPGPRSPDNAVAR